MYIIGNNSVRAVVLDFGTCKFLGWDRWPSCAVGNGTVYTCDLGTVASRYYPGIRPYTVCLPGADSQADGQLINFSGDRPTQIIRMYAKSLHSLSPTDKIRDERLRRFDRSESTVYVFHRASTVGFWYEGHLPRAFCLEHLPFYSCSSNTLNQVTLTYSTEEYCRLVKNFRRL